MNYFCADSVFQYWKGFHVHFIFKEYQSETGVQYFFAS